jgi:hypothetical protein
VQVDIGEDRGQAVETAGDVAPYRGFRLALPREGATDLVGLGANVVDRQGWAAAVSMNRCHSFAVL